MLKRKLVRALVIWTGEWNRELHEAIEAKVFEEYRHSFPAGAKDAPETIEKMRTFYYNRMTNTANTLIGLVAILVAFVSLIVSAFALLK
ncbi:hypothetical protein [Cupriavidus sp. CuC1]|uniref:hypothetical protein n=1 Tax=Cupriavidus sp. CuC1 TaxID=3373131 RepID=UPI0037CD2145